MSIYWERLPNAAAPPPSTMGGPTGSSRFAVSPLTSQSAPSLPGQQLVSAPQLQGQAVGWGSASYPVASASQAVQSGAGADPGPMSPESAILMLAGGNDTSLALNSTSLVSAEGGLGDAAALAAAIHAAAWQGLPSAAVPGMPATAAEAAVAFAANSGACSPSQSFADSPCRHMTFMSNSAAVLSSIPSSTPVRPGQSPMSNAEPLDSARSNRAGTAHGIATPMSQQGVSILEKPFEGQQAQFANSLSSSLPDMIYSAPTLQQTWQFPPTEQ